MLALVLAALMSAGAAEPLGLLGARRQDSACAPAAVERDAAKAGAAADTLRQAVNGRFLIGGALMSQQLEDPLLAALVADQFNCLTGENEFKPIFVHPKPGTFSFTAADQIVGFAERHDMKVVGHTLCWHSQSPEWLFQGADGAPLARDEALRNLKEHIDTVVGHFKGKVIGWDVVNEAISDAKDEYLRTTPAKRAIGDDYVLKAFEFAHAADPNAELYYNDYGNESPEKLKKTIRMIRALKGAGVRLDAVGVQCHLRLEQQPDAPDLLEQAITAYAAEGVKVVVSELDVDVLPPKVGEADADARERSEADPYRLGLPPEVAEAQARLYSRVFRVILKHPGAVKRVTLWGTHDGASWRNYYPIRGRTNHPLLWDRALKPKPAFRAVLDVLAAP
jgi:endo-1,4-beta-xylanase